MQKVGGRTANKQMGMVLTTLVVAIAVFIIRPPSAAAWTSALILAAVFNGIPWAVGIIGVWMTTFREAKDNSDEAKNIKAGLIVLLISSLAFVLNATAGLIFKVEALDLLFPQAVVMVLATIVISKKGEATDKEVGVFGTKSWKNMLTGVCFAAANLTMLISVQLFHSGGRPAGWQRCQRVSVGCPVTRRTPTG